MRPIRWLRRGMVLVSLGAAGGALIVTARHILETPQPLQSALPGEGRIDRKHGGDIYYNVAGDESADPIVLLHDFYLGASNYEYRHLFPRLAPTWRVYAPDWLGFGMSEHPPLAYTGEFYANMLLGFLRDVVNRPAVVVAHGLAANIAARAAADVPELFSRLVLVSPNVEAGIDLDPKPTQVLARAAQRTSLGLVPYAFLSTKPLLRRLAHRRSALTGDDVAREESVEHLYASAHQFGGQHALLALMTGELDLPIQNIFPLLQPPVLLVSGDEDPARPVGMMEDLAVLNPHADLDVLTSAGESAFEDQPAMFTEALLDWLATAPMPQQPQVEEQHPMQQADATPIGADEPDTREPAAEEPALPETVDSADTTGTAGMPDTLATPDTSEKVPGSSAEETDKPTRRSASTPATRSAGGATSKSSVAGARSAQQTTRQTRQSASPRQQPDTVAAKKPHSRSTGSAKNGQPAAQLGKPSAHKSPKAPQDTD